MKVGVFEMGGSSWTGGLTYLRNLGHAVRTNLPTELELYLVHKRTDPPVSARDVAVHFKDIIEVDPFGGAGSAAEFIRKAVSIVAGGDIINSRRFEKTLAREGIQVVFGNGLSGRYKLPSVGWFPDFQHIDLPRFFTRKEIQSRDRQVKYMARNCTLMVFSSQHARKCFVRIHPQHAGKTRVLNFVAHLPAPVKTTSPAFLPAKLKIPEKFIYLPNQLWLHKNHLTAFEAVKMLAARNIPVNLVCTGNLCEERLPDHKKKIFDFIRDNGLSDRIYMLGMVDFDDVYALIRQSCCVLNPSLYEGWSTTVEETKTIGKPMILSDLEVHREQNPPQTEYFGPMNAGQLAAAMQRAWERYPAGPHLEMEAAASVDYLKRSKTFAATFADICRDAVMASR